MSGHDEIFAWKGGVNHKRPSVNPPRLEGHCWACSLVVEPLALDCYLCQLEESQGM